MKSWKAVTLTSATKVYWMLGAMVSTIITARVLGPQGRGVIAAATSWVALFVTCGHLSLSHVIVYLLGRGGRGRPLPIVTGSVLLITGAVTLLAWLVAAVLYAASGGSVFEHIPPAALLVAFFGLPFLLWLEYGSSLLIVLGDLRRLNLAQGAGTTLGVVLVALLVGVFGRGVVAALLASVASYAVTVGLGLLRVLPAARPLGVSRAVLGELLGGGARLHLSAVGTFLFTYTGIILLNHFRPVAEAGYFQLALQLVVAIQVVPMAVAIVAYSLVAERGADGAWYEHRGLVLQTMLYAAVAAGGSYLAAPLIVPLLAGRAFAPAIPVFRILSLSVFGASLAMVMMPQWVGRGYFLRVTALSLLAGALSLVGNTLWIPSHGMVACAWVMTGSYTIHLIANVAFCCWIERRASRGPAPAPLRA
jgi:O-antigen/teichoic acid export membrane protein